SNHYNLNANLFRKNMVSAEACSCGDPRQNINHVIFYCPTISPKSAKLTSFIDKTFPNTSRDIFPLLKKTFCQNVPPSTGFLQNHQPPHLNYSRQACISRALSEFRRRVIKQ
ncbi:hypothetical protein ALC56_04145, partial [Trachymyrmex septentrionalis]